MLFRCSSTVYQAKFKDVIERIAKKGKWGVVSISGVPNYRLHLIPYGPFSQKFYQDVKEDELIGLFMIDETNNQN
jgi:hypothetical protein